MDTTPAPGLPQPEPGDTARLDQLAATWRDQPPAVRAAVEDAARDVQAAPSPAAVARLMAALTEAGLADPD